MSRRKPKSNKSNKANDYDDSLLPSIEEMLDADPDSDFMKQQLLAIEQLNAQRNEKAKKESKKSKKSKKDDDVDDCMVIEATSPQNSSLANLSNKSLANSLTSKEASKSSVDCDFGDSPDSSLDNIINKDKLLKDLDNNLTADGILNKSQDQNLPNESTSRLNEEKADKDNKKLKKDLAKETKKESAVKEVKETKKESAKEVKGTKKEAKKEANEAAEISNSENKIVNVKASKKDDEVTEDKADDSKKARPARQKRTVETKADEITEAPLNKRRKCRGAEADLLQFIAKPVNVQPLGIKLGLSRRSSVRKPLHPELFKNP